MKIILKKTNQNHKGKPRAVGIGSAGQKIKSSDRFIT